MLGWGWLVSVSRVARSLEIHDEGLTPDERRLLRYHWRLLWGTALALYAAGVVLGYLIDPARDALFRWLLARALTLVLVVLTVAVVSRLVFSQRIARLRELSARGAGEQLTQLQDALRVRAEQDRETELFVKSVTHDLRGPLTAIKGYAQMLQRQAQRPESALGDKGLQRIEGAASRAAAMLDDLGDLPQLQAGRPLELRYTHMDLLALVREVLGEYEQVTTGHVLQLETPLSALVGEWDRARVARVLGNLVSNAVKYSPRGGRVVLRVQQSDEADRAWAVVSVHDEGVGIAASEIRHVFEPFYRGSHASGPIEGSGIGLASARWIVEQHGGTISVQSQPGVGSTFAFRLPLLAEPRAVLASSDTGQAGRELDGEVERAAPAGRQTWSGPSRGRALTAPAPVGASRLLLLAAAAATILILGLGGSILRLQVELMTRRQIEGLLAHAEARPLQAADPASSGGGRAYLDLSSEQVLVVVSQLPELPADRAYQVWFVRPDEQRDSGGLLRVDAHGDGTILARAPAGLAAYTAIGITQEPASGSPRPTGPRIVGAPLIDST